jgi:hypothetical protein
MIIYSGYFAAINKLKYPNPISIALKSPEFFKGPVAHWLAPQSNWFWKWKNELNLKTNEEAIEKYSRLYFQTVLRNTTPMEIVTRLEKITSGEDCTIVCFEKPPAEKIIDINSLIAGKNFCHRHLITQFLRFNNIESYELI